MGDFFNKLNDFSNLLDDISNTLEDANSAVSTTSYGIKKHRNLNKISVECFKGLYQKKTR